MLKYICFSRFFVNFYIYVLISMFRIDLCSPQWDCSYLRWQQQQPPVCKWQQQDLIFPPLVEASKQVLQCFMAVLKWHHGLSSLAPVMYHPCNLFNGTLHHLLLNLIRLSQRQRLKLVKRSLSLGCRSIWKVTIIPSSFHSSHYPF